MNTEEVLIKAKLLEKLEKLLAAADTPYVEELSIINVPMDMHITAYKEENASSRLYIRFRRALVAERNELKKELGVS
jgi:hypothetical protein